MSDSPNQIERWQPARTGPSDAVRRPSLPERPASAFPVLPYEDPGPYASRAAWGESLYEGSRSRPAGARDVIKTLYRRRWLGVFTCLGVWALAAAIVVFVPPRYKATTILLIDTAKLELTASRYASADDVVSVFGLPKVANQAAILRTVPAIAETTAVRVVAEASAEEARFLPYASNEKLSEWLRESAITVSAEAGKDQADLIRIEARAGSAPLSARISTLYADSYMRMVREAVSRQRQTALQEQRDRVASASEELALLDEQLRAFWQKNGTVSLDQDAQMAATRISDLQTGLDDARIALSTHSATLEQLEDELGQLDLGRLADRVASSVEAEITLTQQQLASTELSLEQFYSKTPSLRTDPSQSPQVMKLVKDAEGMRSRLADLSARYVQEVMATGGIDLTKNTEGQAYVLSLRRRIAEERVAKRSAEARVAAISNRLAAFQASRTRFSDQSVSLSQIQRNRQLADERVKAEIDRLGELQLAEPSDYVKRIQAAAVPEKPAFPNAMLLLAGGLVLGILLGGGTAYSWSSIDQNVHETEDVAGLGIPVRGTLPDLSRLVKRLVGKQKFVQVGGRRVSSSLVVVHAPQEPEAALVRKYSLGLAARTPRGGSILFTSADTGAGKTTLTANAAAALSLAGYRTLLIDADIFRSGQMHMLGLTALSHLDVETGTFPPGGGVEQFGGALQLLFGLSLRSRVPADSESFAAHAAAHLMNFYGQHFDYILIDTPPTAASSIASGIAPYANTRVLIAGAGHTHRDLLAMAAAELTAQGSPPTEIAINRMDMSGPTAYRTAYQQAQAYYGTSKSS